MESKAVLIIVSLVVASAAISMAKNNEEGSICGVSKSELMECKAAVATGSATPPPPTETCCSSLKHADLACFCTFKTNKYLPFLGINATRAMQLPTQCDPTLVAPCS